MIPSADYFELGMIFMAAIVNNAALFLILRWIKRNVRNRKFRYALPELLFHTHVGVYLTFLWMFRSQIFFQQYGYIVIPWGAVLWMHVIITTLVYYIRLRRNDNPNTNEEEI